MPYEDQREFYSCPLCGTGTGNDIDNDIYGAPEHDCPEVINMKKGIKTYMENNWEEQFEIEFGGVLVPGYRPDGYVDYSRVKKFISSVLQEQRQRMAERIGEEQEKYRPAYEEEDKAYVAGLQAALNIVLGEDNN